MKCTGIQGSDKGKFLFVPFIYELQPMHANEDFIGIFQDQFS